MLCSKCKDRAGSCCRLHSLLYLLNSLIRIIMLTASKSCAYREVRIGLVEQYKLTDEI